MIEWPLPSAPSDRSGAGIRRWRMHPRRPSAGLPGCPLLPDEVSRRDPEVDGPTTRDALEDFLGCRTGDFPLEDVLDVVGERLASGSSSPGQLSMQPVGYVSDLDHLRHAKSMSHVHNMFNCGFRQSPAQKLSATVSTFDVSSPGSMPACHRPRRPSQCRFPTRCRPCTGSPRRGRR